MLCFILLSTLAVIINILTSDSSLLGIFFEQANSP